MRIKPTTLLVLLTLIASSFHSVAREKLHLQVKDIRKQSKENRINYFFALEYSWQKEPGNFKRIDSLKIIAQQLDDDNLAEYAQLLWHEYKIYFAKNSREKAQYLKIAEEFVEDSQNPELKGHLYYAIGIYAFYMHEIDYGLPLVYQSKKILESIGYHRFKHRSYYYKGFFDLYYDFEDFPKAIEVANWALKNPDDLLYYPEDYYNNIALCYRMMKEYDQAMKYFNLATKDAKKRHDKSFEALVEGNIAYLYFLQEDYKKALPYLYRDFEINKDKIPEESNLVRYMIARCLLRLDSVKKAETFLKYKDSPIPIWVDPAYRLDKFRVVSLYHEKTGNLRKAIAYRDSTTNLINEIRKKYDITKLKKFEMQVAAEHSLNEKLSLQFEMKRQKLMRNGIIVILSLLFIFLSAFFFMRYKKEKQLQLEKQKRAEQQIVNAQEQLRQFIHNIKEKNDIIDQLTAEAAQSVASNIAEKTASFRILDNLQKSVILTDENWRDFKIIFEKIYPNFFSKLSYEYPDMSPAETRLSALQKLEMPTKEMANMLGISADSVKKARYRLKKKYPELVVDKTFDSMEEPPELN